MENENHQNCAGGQGQNDAAHDPGYVCKQNSLLSSVKTYSLWFALLFPLPLGFSVRLFMLCDVYSCMCQLIIVCSFFVVRFIRRVDYLI